jgi:prephenate dehydrogenase
MQKTKVALLGCGYTGLVLGHALKATLKDVEVIGNDKDRETLKRAEKAKAIDRGEWNIPNACDNASVILISTPQEEHELAFRAMGKDVNPRTLVATIGGSNTQDLRLAHAYLPDDVPFFASSLIFHPDRGMSPNDAPEASAIKRAVWTVAPRPGTSPELVNVYAALITELEALPVFVDPTERDGLSISVDAMPAVLSSALMLAVSGDSAWRERQWMAGSTFGIATSQVDHADTMLQAIMAQPDAMVHWLNQIMLQCMAIRDALRERDEKTVRALLEKAKETRERWLVDWRRGRDDGRQTIERQGGGMLRVFVGDRMADRLTGSKKQAPR